MPIVANTTLSTQQHCNSIMAAAFFPRSRDWLYPEFCGSYETNRFVEPFAILGAPPQLKQWNGNMAGYALPSYKLNVPQPLWKVIQYISRPEAEGDQTSVLLRQNMDGAGIALANFPEQLWAYKLLNGASATSNSETFNGITYQATLDNVPFFATNHTYGPAGTFMSNVITHPNTNFSSSGSSFLSLDAGTQASLMQVGYFTALQQIKTQQDNTGMPIFQTLDSKKSVIIAVPPCLEGASALAFSTPGSVIGGLAGGAQGATSNIVPQFVKKVVSSSLLAGFPNPLIPGTGTLISPVNQTDWYIFIVDDRVRPFYMSYFVPTGPSDLFPKGYNVESVISSMMKQADSIGSPITRQAAALFASSVVEQNIEAQGNNAQESVVEKERFFISPRYRGNCAYGPPFTAYRVHAAGAS